MLIDGQELREINIPDLIKNCLHTLATATIAAGEYMFELPRISNHLCTHVEIHIGVKLILAQTCHYSPNSSS